MRTLLLSVLLGFLAAPSALAQTPCVDGAVTAGAFTFACDSVDLLAHVPATDLGAGPQTVCQSCFLDVWGWTDPDTGREYVAAGGYVGVTFVDVTTPTAPRVLGRLASGGGRDMKTIGHYLYAADHSSDGLAVFDLRRLRNLGTNPGRRFTPDAETASVDAHNVVVADGAALVAAVAAGECSNGYHFFDVSDPLAPADRGCYTDGGIVHDAQCLVYDGPDADYTGRTVCVGSNALLVDIIDATDPADIQPISQVVYPSPGYTHQGWFTEDRRHFLLGDEYDEIYDETQTRTIVLDVSDLDAPEFVGAWFNPNSDASDHNQYVQGGHLYQANYTSGLRVLSLAGVATADLAEVAFFDTFPDAVGEFDELKGAWSVYPFFPSGTVAVMDQNYGLFLLRVDPDALVVAREAPPAPDGLRLTVETPARGDATVRLTAPAGTPVRLAVYDLLGRTLAVAFDGVGTGAAQAVAVGAGLPAGVVLVRAETAAGAVTRRLTIVR